MTCPLCHEFHSVLLSNTKYGQSLWHCRNCELVFKPESQHLSPESEKKRYQHHQNSNLDEGYRKFLNQLLDPALQALSEQSFRGKPLATARILDFGSGPFPSLANLVQERGFQCKLYDPYFAPDQELKEKTWDLILTSEVVEHFRSPDQDWQKLTSLLAPRGLLAVMTQFHHLKDQQHWWYAEDPTHLCFYNEKTWAFLEKNFALESLFQKNPVALFQLKQ